MPSRGLAGYKFQPKHNFQAFDTYNKYCILSSCFKRGWGPFFMVPSADSCSTQSHRHWSNRSEGGMHLCLTISRFPAWIPKKTKFISNNKPEGQIEVGKTQTCNFQSQCEFYLSPFLVECLLQLYTQLISSGFTPFGEDRKHSFASQIACWVP